MTNYSLLCQAKLVKMIDEYITSTVRGETCDTFTGACLLQVVSTNPFEICDSSHHMLIRNPSRILEELKTINSNITLLSMKGALISLQKWGFEAQYIPATDELKFDMLIHEVKYIDGIGTAELVMNTAPLLEAASLKNKFKRLKKFLIAKEFDASHPIDETLALIDEEQYKESETKRKADLRAQFSIQASVDRRDPFFIGGYEQYPAKSSVSKSQISQVSDFDVLSINSATQMKYGGIKFKPSLSKPFQSMPGPDAFALNLDLLSSQPLLQKIQIDDDIENIQEAPKRRFPGSKRDDEPNVSRFNEIELEEIEEEVPGLLIPGQEVDDSAKKSVIPIPESREEEKETPQPKADEKNRQKLKRNFHQMIEENKAQSIEFPHQDLKKAKYQWGLNHKSEQQEFRKQIEGRKSMGMVAPETDTLMLLASQFWTENEKNETVVDNKNNEKEDEVLIIDERDEIEKSRESSRSIQQVSRRTVSRNDIVDVDGNAIQEKPVSKIKKNQPNKMDYMPNVEVLDDQRYYSKGSMSSNDSISKDLERFWPFDGKGSNQKANEKVSMKKVVEPVRVKENKVREEKKTTEKGVTALSKSKSPLKNGNSKPIEAFFKQKVREETSRGVVKATKERILVDLDSFKKIESHATQMARISREKEMAKQKNFIDLTEEVGLQKRASSYARDSHNNMEPHRKDMTVRYAEKNNGLQDRGRIGAGMPQENRGQSRERSIKKIENPLDPTKVINMDDFKDICARPKKFVASGVGGIDRKNLKQKPKQVIEII